MSLIRSIHVDVKGGCELSNSVLCSADKILKLRNAVYEGKSPHPEDHRVPDEWQPRAKGADQGGVDQLQHFRQPSRWSKVRICKYFLFLFSHFPPVSLQRLCLLEPAQATVQEPWSTSGDIQEHDAFPVHPVLLWFVVILSQTVSGWSKPLTISLFVHFQTTAKR